VTSIDSHPLVVEALPPPPYRAGVLRCDVLNTWDQRTIVAGAGTTVLSEWPHIGGQVVVWTTRSAGSGQAGASPHRVPVSAVEYVSYPGGAS
jgi:hypothetical protein